MLSLVFALDEKFSLVYVAEIHLSQSIVWWERRIDFINFNLGFADQSLGCMSLPTDLRNGQFILTLILFFIIDVILVQFFNFNLENLCYKIFLLVVFRRDGVVDKACYRSLSIKGSHVRGKSYMSHFSVFTPRTASSLFLNLRCVAIYIVAITQNGYAVWVFMLVEGLIWIVRHAIIQFVFWLWLEVECTFITSALLDATFHQFYICTVGPRFFQEHSDHILLHSRIDQSLHKVGLLSVEVLLFVGLVVLEVSHSLLGLFSFLFLKWHRIYALTFEESYKLLGYFC